MISSITHKPDSRQLSLDQLKVSCTDNQIEIEPRNSHHNQALLRAHLGVDQLHPSPTSLENAKRSITTKSVFIDWKVIQGSATLLDSGSGNQQKVDMLMHGFLHSGLVTVPLEYVSLISLLVMTDINPSTAPR